MSLKGHLCAAILALFQKLGKTGNHSIVSGAYGPYDSENPRRASVTMKVVDFLPRVTEVQKARVKVAANLVQSAIIPVKLPDGRCAYRTTPDLESWIQAYDAEYARLQAVYRQVRVTAYTPDLLLREVLLVRLIELGVERWCDQIPVRRGRGLARNARGLIRSDCISGQTIASGEP